LRQLQVETKARPRRYEITVVAAFCLRPAGSRDCLGRQAQRIALISNKKFFRCMASNRHQGSKKDRLFSLTLLVGDGEITKSLKTVEYAVRFLSEEASSA